MHSLAAFDANLVRVLHVLLQERHILRASRRLHLSPSATSHALSRLRVAFADPLLVRVGRKLVLTSRATELLGAAGEIVEQLESLLLPQQPFRSKDFTGALTVSTSDHVRFVLMSPMDRALRAHAPNAAVHFLSFGPHSFDDLREGHSDLCIGMFDKLSDDLYSRPLFDDRLVAVVRKKHPIAKQALVSAQDYAAMTHVLVAPTAARRGMIDRVLGELGLKRAIAYTLPTFLDALHFVAASDHVITLPERVARPLLRTLGLVTLQVELPLPTFRIIMVWHGRAQAEPAQAWFRNELATCTSTLEPLGSH